MTRYVLPLPSWEGVIGALSHDDGFDKVLHDRWDKHGRHVRNKQGQIAWMAQITRHIPTIQHFTGASKGHIRRVLRKTK
jgi:hypothetical protein